MRIAVWHNLPSGGGKRALYDQVGSLLDRGHEVESWCPPSADQEFLPLSRLIPEHVVGTGSPAAGRWATIRGIVQDTHPDIEAMDRHCRECAEEIKQGGFDVLFANSCREFRTTSIGRFAKLPSVLYVQEPFRRLYEASPDPPWAADERLDSWTLKPSEISRVAKRSLQMRRNQIQIREEVRNASAFSLIACNSLYSRESILRAYGLSAEVCYLGIDDKRLTPNGTEDSRKPFFLTVGAGEPEKNVPFLVRSLGQRKDTSWPLVWVANVKNGKYVDDTRRLAERLGVPLDIRSNISHPELLALYRQASLFLYSPRLEPFGLAPLEAASCGLPVVAVAEAGVRETVSNLESGFLVAANEAEFAAKVDYILSQPQLLRAMASSARAYVEAHWTLGGAVDRLEALLIQVVMPHSRCPALKVERGI